jgi:CRP/FNR family transcriptional regulator, cyclic AMP receptor protein
MRCGRGVKPLHPTLLSIGTAISTPDTALARNHALDMKKALYILAELSDRDFEWLIQTGRRRRLYANEVLIREGEPSEALYVILTGTLGVFSSALEGEKVAALESGEVVGEISFIDSRLPSATVKALDDATLWAIPRTQLNTKLSNDVSFASNFYRAMAILLCDRLRNTVTQLGHSKAQEFNQEPNDDEPNPRVLESLDIAKIRLSWLLDRLREAS